MIDSRGKKLDAGDEVVIGRTPIRLITGILLKDPDDIRWSRFHVEDEQGRVYRIDKDSSRIVSLTKYFDDKISGPVAMVMP